MDSKYPETEFKWVGDLATGHLTANRTFRGSDNARVREEVGMWKKILSLTNDDTIETISYVRVVGKVNDPSAIQFGMEKLGLTIRAQEAKR